MNEEIKEKILSPIPGDNPCGEPLKYSDEYNDLKSKRKEESFETIDPKFKKKGDKETDWVSFSDECKDLLINKSKDLHVLNFYVDAITRAYGFEGLLFGISLYEDFIQKFWEHMHPQIEEENDFTSRIGQIQWLATKFGPLMFLIDFKLKKIDLSSNNIFFNYFSAKKSKEQGGQEKAESFRKLYLSFKKEDIEYVLKSYETVESHYKKIEDIVFEKLQVEDTNEIELDFNPVFQDLKEVKNFLINLLDEKIKNETNNEAQNDKSQLNKIPSAKIVESNIAFSDREQAYKVIEKANQFLLKFEPHSPSPYLIKRALQWRKKSMYELVIDILPKGSAGALISLLGLKASPKKKNNQNQENIENQESGFDQSGSYDQEDSFDQDMGGYDQGDDGDFEQDFQNDNQMMEGQDDDFN